MLIQPEHLIRGRYVLYRLQYNRCRFFIFLQFVFAVGSLAMFWYWAKICVLNVKSQLQAIVHICSRKKTIGKNVVTLGYLVRFA